LEQFDVQVGTNEEITVVDGVRRILYQTMIKNRALGLRTVGEESGDRVLAERTACTKAIDELVRCGYVALQ
jgi:hypothetical protein